MKRVCSVALALLFLLTAMVGPPALAHASEEGHGDAHGLSLRSMLMQFINFAILVSIFVFAYKRVGKDFILNRSKNVEKKIDEAKEAFDRAEQRFREYEEKLAVLDREIDELRTKGRAEAEQEKREIIRMAEETSRRIKEQAKLIADQEFESAKKALYEEISILSVELAGDLLRKKMTPEDRKRLIEEYILQLGEPN